MKVTTKELERCEVLMTVEIEPQKEQKMLQKAAKKIAREVRIPGFRPGKAPYNVVVRRFGVEAVQQEVMEQSVDKLLQDAIVDLDVEPSAQIQLESIDWTPLTIKLKIPTQPVVTLGDYRDIRMEAEAVEVTEKDIQEALERFQEQTVAWHPVERPAEMGDIVSMSLVTKDGDKVLEEHESVEHELKSQDGHEDHNHPDFGTPFVGVSEGEQLSLTFNYPEDFGNAEYAGKDIIWEAEVFSIKEKEVEPLDDDFAKSVSDFDTLAELKADIEQNISKSRENQQDSDLGKKVLGQIIEKSQVEWAQAFEDERIENETKRQEQQFEQYGLTLDNYLTMEKKTKEDFVEETRQSVVDQLQRGLVLGEIAAAENLKITESDILARAKQVADMSGAGDDFWRNILASEAQQRMLAQDLIVDKTMHWLAAMAKGEDMDAKAEVEPTEPAADLTIEGAASEVSEANEEEAMTTSETDGSEANEEESAETSSEADVSETNEETAAEPAVDTEDETAEA